MSQKVRDKSMGYHKRLKFCGQNHVGETLRTYFSP